MTSLIPDSRLDDEMNAGDSADVFMQDLPSQTLYIKNLNEKVSTTDLRRVLYTLFGQFGAIKDIIAQRGQNKRGQAFVVFDDLSRAALALKHLHNETILGKPMKIEYARTKSNCVKLAEFAKQSSSASAPTSFHKTTQAAHGSSTAGQAKPRQRKTAKELQMELDNPEHPLDHQTETEGDKANSTKQNNKRRKLEAPVSKTLYVTNLPPQLAVKDMKALFEAFPGFMDLRPVLRAGSSQTPQTTGATQVAFVDFEQLSQAEQAQKGLDGLSVTGFKLVVQLAKAS